MSEAFVYLWYDAGWKRTGGPRYYIGKHKGTLDSGYVCSSKYMKPEWEKRGCKQRGCRHLFGDKGHHGDFHRRVLAYGTEQEMIDFEIKLLETRKDYFGSRYYNRVVMWTPCMSGEKHPAYKHGMSKTKSYQKRQKKKYLKKLKEPKKVVLTWSDKKYSERYPENLEKKKGEAQLKAAKRIDRNQGAAVAKFYRRYTERKKREILESIASER